MDRRKFIKHTGSAGICLCSASVLLSGCNMVSGISDVPLMGSDHYTLKNDKLKVILKNTESEDIIGKAKKLKFNYKGAEQKLIIIHPDDGNFLCFEDSCTHGQRELNYYSEENILICSSFGHSTFKTDGTRIKGPAKESLKQFEVNTYEEFLEITL